MHLAQQLEINLRAFLYTADYHAFIDLPLTNKQKDRFKTFKGFIDERTCGQLIMKLRAAITIEDERFWQALTDACGHRNRLAHSFLTEHNFDRITPEGERDILEDLCLMTADIRNGLIISQAIRDRVERDSDSEYESFKRAMAVLGVPDYEDTKRRYEHPRRHAGNARNA